MSTQPPPDWQGLFKAIRAISGELRLDNVIKIFLQSLLEHSHAQASVLILPNDRTCRLEIPDEILFHQTRQTSVLPENPLDVPLSFLQMALYNRELCLLNNTLSEQFAIQDPYMRQYHPRAMLALPLFRRNVLSSLIYLEHRREMDIFTPARVESIEILSQQWIIALENARLYHNFYEKFQQNDENHKANNPTESNEPLKSRDDFNQQFEQEWLRMANEGLPLSIILCTPDQWAAYQTNEGPEIAKESLEKIGRVIQSRLKRAADVVAHYNNETLIILLPMTPWEGALHVAEDIQQIVRLIQLPQTNSREHLLVRLSMGLASVLSCRESLPEAILDIAGELLKDARKQGGNCILSENI
jgi:diguanylate cyclase (GGDEF)-like protein